MSDLRRRLFAMEPFRTRHDRLGKMARVSQRHVHSYTTDSGAVHRIDWPETRESCLESHAFAPTPRQQWISQNLCVALRAYFRANRRGIVIYAPCDIVIRRDPLRTRQPDLFVFLRGRNDVGDLRNLADQPALCRAARGAFCNVTWAAILMG